MRKTAKGALMLALLAAGCQQSDTKKADTQTAAKSVQALSDTTRLSVADASAPGPVPKRRYRLGVLFPFLAAPFWANEAYGVLDQAKELGVDVVWLSADGYDNIDKQTSQMEDLVSQKVDAILLAATSYTGTARAVDRARDAGIPVITHVTSSSSSGVVAAVLDDDEEIGREQARHMRQALQGTGEVVMLNGPAAAEWSSRRVAGFKAELARSFPNIRIVSEKFGIPDRADANRLAEDLIVTFPKIAGIFTVADGMAMGAVDALKRAGKQGKVIVTTASFSRETVPYIKNGFIAVNVDENPVLIGRTAVNTAVRYLNDGRAPKVVFVPNPSVTKETLGAVDSTKQWAPAGWRIR